MKKFFALLWTVSLLAGCGGGDGELDDPDVVNDILEEALDFNQLKWNSNKQFFYGPKAEGPYTGWVKWSHKNGKLAKLMHYKDGLVHGEWSEWHENGQKRIGGFLKSAQVAEGVVTQWHENGQKAIETNFENGLREGPHTEWYETGEMSLKAQFKDNEKDGTWIFLNKDGTEKERLLF